MKKQVKAVKEVKTSKELNKLYEEIMKLATAREGRGYKLPVGKEFILVGGDAIKMVHEIVMGYTVIPGELPEDKIARKYKAQKAVLRCRVREHLNNMKFCVPAEELFDMYTIVTAIKRNKVNEDIFKLARKYFEVPTIAEI